MISRPKLGVCTWTLGEMPLVEIAQTIKELDYDGVELLGDVEAHTAQEAKQIFDEAGLTIFSLTPMNVDLAHPETAVRQEAVDYYLRLLDFAAVIGQPLVSCHGFVGRVRPLASRAEEYAWLVAGVRQIGIAAADRGLQLVFEVLNRYETHLINRGEEGMALITAVDLPNVKLLLDAYHMNMEEQDQAGAIRQAGDRLGLYHMSDSNRRGIGRGHTKLGAQLWALEDIGYDGPIIMECTVPNSDPFAPVQSDVERELLLTYLRESRLWF